jgi:hypothetical protein
VERPGDVPRLQRRLRRLRPGRDQAKKSVDQAAKEYTVPAKFKGYKASENPTFGGAKPNLEIAYKELGGR